jgi:Phosphatidylserine/phosphatidylglycerophosphate/cardiolipin synthases and related enzymes
MIASQIDKAKSSIYVQAYHLTNKAIINALQRANSRGVTIILVLDKQAKREALSLLDQGFLVLIDNKPRIAHNKVMIIDDKTVITGSFNFTKAAQYANAENVFIVEDEKIAKLYEDNFFKREHLSRRVN